MAVMDWVSACGHVQAQLFVHINRLGSSLLLWEICDELDIYIGDNHVNGLSNFSFSLTFTKVTGVSLQ